ncbi:hypothetical protein CYLTODRAFT_415470 [Cylindrobasidium torrendii FP15055 ss-10]|uniref:Uncharacterized protein n=1 Tax=Cylindrobasidium torrendii FP15055 ss-10 TaxID=1314674 RepID=A0A0D7AU62_9AGAR|nr:hypothetical protein CYLTODRAFT_415470 [Cylindrobasidium torrendii FP15055 ss-10]
MRTQVENGPNIIPEAPFFGTTETALVPPHHRVAHAFTTMAKNIEAIGYFQHLNTMNKIHDQIILEKGDFEKIETQPVSRFQWVLLFDESGKQDTTDERYADHHSRFEKKEKIYRLRELNTLRSKQAQLSDRISQLSNMPFGSFNVLDHDNFSGWPCRLGSPEEGLRRKNQMIEIASDLHYRLTQSLDSVKLDRQPTPPASQNPDTLTPTSQSGEHIYYSPNIPPATILTEAPQPEVESEMASYLSELDENYQPRKRPRSTTDKTRTAPRTRENRKNHGFPKYDDGSNANHGKVVLTIPPPGSVRRPGGIEEEDSSSSSVPPSPSPQNGRRSMPLARTVSPGPPVASIEDAEMSAPGNAEPSAMLRISSGTFDLPAPIHDRTLHHASSHRLHVVATSTCILWKPPRHIALSPPPPPAANVNASMTFLQKDGSPKGSLSPVAEDEDVHTQPDDVDMEPDSIDEVGDLIESTLLLIESTLLSPDRRPAIVSAEPSPSPGMSRQSTPMNKPPRFSNRNHDSSTPAQQRPTRNRNYARESTPSRKRSWTPQQVLHAPSPAHSDNARRSTPVVDADKKRKSNYQDCNLVKAARNAGVRDTRANGALGIRRLPEVPLTLFSLPEFLHSPAGCLADTVIAQINQREDPPFASDMYVTPVLPPVKENGKDKGTNRSHKKRKVS